MGTIVDITDLSPIEEFTLTPPKKKEKGEPGEEDSEPGEGEPGEGEPGEGEEDGRPGKGKPGKGKPGEGEGEGESDDWDDDPVSKDIESKLSQKKDGNTEDAKKAQGKVAQDQSKSSQSKKTIGQLADVGTATPVNPINWRKLLAEFVSTASLPETTYAKPATRSVATQMGVAAQIGAAALKPGEKPGQPVNKLLMVFDTSGSMSESNKIALSEAKTLLSRHKGALDNTVGIAMFASSYILIEADLKKNIAWAVDTFKNLGKSPQNKKAESLDVLFSKADTGGTLFTTSLASELSSMAAKGYNIVLFTDTDILYRSNWENFQNLYNMHRAKLFAIFDSRNSYNEVVAKLGGNPRKFGHM